MFPDPVAPVSVTRVVKKFTGQFDDAKVHGQGSWLVETVKQKLKGCNLWIANNSDNSNNSGPIRIIRPLPVSLISQVPGTGRIRLIRISLIKLIIL